MSNIKEGERGAKRAASAGEIVRLTSISQTYWSNPLHREKRSRLLIDRNADPEWREFISIATSQALRENPRVYSTEAKKRFSEAHGGIRNKISPFVRRKFTVREISAIYPEFTSRQISTTMGHMRDKDKSLRPTEEERSFIQHQSHLGKPRNSHGKDPSIMEQMAGLFSRRLFEKGLIRDDLVLWSRLAILLQQFPFQLTNNNLDKLRLEVYLLAQIATARGIIKPLIIYQQTGITIDSEWFKTSLFQQEQMIREIVGEASYRLQKQKFCFERQKGSELGIDAEGETVFVSPELQKQREKIREWSPPPKVK